MKSLGPTTAAWRTEATPTNGSYQNRLPICYVNHLIPAVLIFIISLIGLAGNASVIWFLGFHMHRNADYTHILNLAAADFLLLCLYITVCLINVIVFTLHFHINDDGIIYTGTIMFYIAGLSMLCAISTERCLLVLWPIWYHCHRPRHTSAIMCALFWVFSLLLSILQWVYFYHRYKTDVKFCGNIAITITAWVFFFLFVVLLGSSLALLGRMLCGSKRKPLTRLYVTILLTVLVLLLCSLSFGVHFSHLYGINIGYDAQYCLTLVSLVLSSVNSSANPIIYFFVGSFRQRLWGQNLKLVLERALQDTPEKGEGGGSLSQGTLELSGSRVEQG